MNILVTGGAGFIGSHFVRHLIEKYPSYNVINYDLLTYSGNLDNISDLQSNPRHLFIQGDISDETMVESVVEECSVDVIVNFAAESHVDRSIQDSKVFIKSNVMGTHVLLEVARRKEIDKFVQISTDEVYGSLNETGYFTEETPYSPNSPYAASKAAADLLVRSYYQTYGMNVNITHCSNNYGPFQYPEKLIPLMVTNALREEPLPIYGDGKNIRDWLHVQDHCSAVDLVLHRAEAGETFNIGGHNEYTNIDIVERIISFLGASKNLITYVEDRLGHDRRYAINADKIQKKLGWRPVYSFDEGLTQTIQWYLDNPLWWQKMRNRQEMEREVE